jgi:SagB-type dehydrogenase family enzyme
LGSIEIYPVVVAVEGVAQGLYHYDSVGHRLVLLKAGNFRSWLRYCVFFQLEFSEAAVAFVLTSAFGRLGEKYGTRALRLGYLDAGFVAQNLILVATAMGLVQCPTAGFVDDELNDAVQIDGTEAATVLVVLVGPPCT